MRNKNYGKPSGMSDNSLPAGSERNERRRNERKNIGPTFQTISSSSGKVLGIERWSTLVRSGYLIRCIRFQIVRVIIV